MDMRHWGRAQVITEHWRANFHELINQLSGGETDSYGALEDAVMEVFTHKIGAGVKLNAAGVRAKGTTIIRKAGMHKIRGVLDEWHEQGLLARDGAKKSALYWLQAQTK